MLERYLDALATQEAFNQGEQQGQTPFEILERIPEINRIRYYQPFNNGLDTIPETDNETNTTQTTETGSVNYNIDNDVDVQDDAND